MKKSMIFLMLKTLLFSFFAYFGIVSVKANDNSPKEDLQFHYSQGTKAYQEGDNKKFLNHMVVANQLRPNHPTLIHNLAAGYALNNQSEEAYKVMRDIVLMNADKSFMEDKDFKNLQNNDELQALKDLAIKLKEPIANSKQLMSIDLGTLHPEGIAFDEKTNNYYVGGVHDRRLVKVNANNNFSEVISYKNNELVFSVMGIAVDQVNNVVWICTAALPEMVEYKDEYKGMSSVIALNFQGEVLKSEAHSGSHVFGDIKLLKDGSVLISDTGENKIYSASLNSNIELFADLKDHSWNLQGIALNDDESVLYFADYLSGLYRLYMDDFSVQKIDLGLSVSSKGFDGIYHYDNSIIAIQNGTNPKKTWHFKLNEQGSEIQQALVIDQALNILNEPTQGVINGNQFIYIANSPWSLYEKGILKTELLKEAVFLSYQLDSE